MVRKCKNTEFIGSLNELWSFIKNNLNRTMIKKHKNSELFEYFCDFMMKEHSILTGKEAKILRSSARKKRVEGNNLFKDGKIKQAIYCYNESLKLCPNKYGDDRSLYFSNLAISYFKINEIYNSYKSALSGLAYNCGVNAAKLNNILSKCYSKMNISDFTSNISNKKTFNPLNHSLFINKVQNVILFKLY